MAHEESFSLTKILFCRTDASYITAGTSSVDGLLAFCQVHAFRQRAAVFVIMPTQLHIPSWHSRLYMLHMHMLVSCLTILYVDANSQAMHA